MNILYKYSDILPISYFDNPTIKISVTEFLNDPFECNASENIFRSIENHLKKQNITDELLQRGIKAYSDSIGIMLGVNGIVSLSETPRNSLMWAHYAKQHNGICIGYKKNFLQKIKGDDEFQIVINEPTKVNYDNLRFEMDFYCSDDDDIDKNSIIQHLFKKSDEWIYEKEHRCIIPYAKADKLVILSKNPKVDKIIWPKNEKADPHRQKVGNDFLKVIRHAINTELISKTKINNEFLINHEKMNSAQCILLQSSKDCLFLINIEADSIESVYFGCNVSLETIKPYFDKLHDKYNLYKFTLSKKRFELIPEVLTPQMFI
ncbi:DUF2971 domain-containing protein [Aeromonas veronii]